VDIPQPLRELVAALDAARDAGDAAAIAALYLDDAMLITPDGVCRGRAAIAACYQVRFDARPGARAQPRPGPAKFFFFPPVVHAVATVNGRHGEKHSFIDILTQQGDGSYLVACSSWTLR
jgi:hypothetical protein